MCVCASRERRAIEEKVQIGISRKVAVRCVLRFFVFENVYIALPVRSTQHHHHHHDNKNTTCPSILFLLHAYLMKLDDGCLGTSNHTIWQ